MRLVPSARVTIIDGRSGSGKTVLAERIARQTGAQVLALDDLYAGWEGLALGSAAVATALRRGRYQRYDWHAGQFDDWVSLDRSRPLVIEGCGALTHENLEAAEQWALACVDPPYAGDEVRPVRAIWLDEQEEVRRSRALARDGEMFAAHWDTWAAQEDAHYARHQPWLLAHERSANG